MAYISSPNFSILMNGGPSKFFKSSRGIHQGCPLFPFLFLLVAKCLSRLLISSIKDSSIKGISMADLIKVTQLLFVDDVLLFGEGLVRD